METNNLTSKTGTFFECKVRYGKTMEDGLQKKVTETYIVDALSWAEAEARITEEMSSYISGEFDITSIKKCNFKELFIDNDGEADYWYKAKLQFITINEKSQKEKRSNVYYLVNAATLDSAKHSIDSVMGGTMIDYVVASISDTPYMDVFVYNKEQHTNEH